MHESYLYVMNEVHPTVRAPPNVRVHANERSYEVAYLRAKNPDCNVSS